MLAAAVRNVMYRVTFRTENVRVQRIEKVIQHQANSAFSRSTTRSGPMPREPFTSTRSPGTNARERQLGRLRTRRDVDDRLPPACRPRSLRPPSRAPARRQW